MMTSPVPFFVLRSHHGSVTALCFVKEINIGKESLCHQPFILSGSDVGEIFLWNLKIYRVQFKLSGHNGKMISWLNYYQENIISQGRDGLINLWGYQDDSWTVVREISVSGIGFCASSLFVNNNIYLTTLDQTTCFIKVMDFETNEIKSVLKPCDNTYGMCMCLKTFALQNNIFVISGYENGSLLVWNCQNNQVISSLVCHKETMMCLDFDDSVKQGISGSADEYLVVWKLDDHLNLTEKQKIKITNCGVACVAIRPDSKIVLSGGWDGRIRVFSWKTLKPLAVLICHTDIVNCISFSNCIINKYSSVFAVGSKDKNISLWSLY